MPAKILAFDPNRKVPARHYTPIAMRGRLLHMPSRAAEAASFSTQSASAQSGSAQSGSTQSGSAHSRSAQKDGLNWCAVAPGQDRRRG